MRCQSSVPRRCAASAGVSSSASALRLLSDWACGGAGRATLVAVLPAPLVPTLIMDAMMRPTRRACIPILALSAERRRHLHRVRAAPIADTAPSPGEASGAPSRALVPLQRGSAALIASGSEVISDVGLEPTRHTRVDLRQAVDGGVVEAHRA